MAQNGTPEKTLTATTAIDAGVAAGSASMGRAAACKQRHVNIRRWGGVTRPEMGFGYWAGPAAWGSGPWPVAACQRAASIVVALWVVTRSISRNGTPCSEASVWATSRT